MDDTQAILLALAAKNMQVVGFTGIFGNVDTDLAVDNVLRLLDVTDKDLSLIHI